MKVEDKVEAYININNYPSRLNLKLLIEAVKKSNLANKEALLEEWENLKLLEVKKYKDYDLKCEVEMFKIKLIESLVFVRKDKFWQLPKNK